VIKAAVSLYESIFQTVFLSYPESLCYTYYKCLYSDYFRLVGSYHFGVAQYSSYHVLRL